MPGLTSRFPDPPGESRVDIVVLGESSARGVPYHEWLSVGEIVAWKLREAFPDRQFPVEYLAKPGLTLDKVHFWMTSLERRPDLVILYAGHNEFQMRYDWAHAARHYSDETPPTPVTLQDLARKYSPLCRLIQQTVMIYRIALPPPPSVRRQLVDVPAYTAEDYATRLNDFRTRLEEMTAYCERVGALVVLVIPPGNDADFEPNRSFLPPQTPRAERETFAAEFRAARKAEDADPTAGIAAYRALLASQPRFAEAHYRLARLLEATGQREEADRHYVAARDHDGFPMRCTSDFQDAYRDVAARHPGAILIDGPAVLRGLSPRGVVGDNFFTDGFHPSLIGYTGLARAILQGLHARHAFGRPESSSSPEVSPSDCSLRISESPRPSGKSSAISRHGSIIRPRSSGSTRRRGWPRPNVIVWQASGSRRGASRKRSQSRASAPRSTAPKRLLDPAAIRTPSDTEARTGRVLDDGLAMCSIPVASLDSGTRPESNLRKFPIGSR